MTLGSRIRELRKAKGLTLRELGARIGVGFTYLCKIETGKLGPGHMPSNKLAAELDSDENELILLAQRIPDPIRLRIFQRPDAFNVLAKVEDSVLDQVIDFLRDGVPTGQDGISKVQSPKN